MGFLSALGRETPGAATGLASTNYAPALDTGLGSYQTANAGQNELARQLLATISGTGGPNLAQQQLLEATQRNVQGAAAAIGGQRGINPGLAARQIQNTAAMLNQDAAGKAAQLRLQQQILAQQQLGQLYGQQMQGGTSLYNTAGGLQNQQNATQVQNQALEQQAHATDLGAATGLAGATASAAGTVGTAALGMPKPPKMAHGGEVPDQRAFMEAYARTHQQDPARAQELLLAWHAGKRHGAPQDMSEGGEVGGPAPRYPGDDERNDQTPIMATSGELVIPRSIAHDPEQVKRFVEELHRQERARDAMTRSPGPLLARRRR